MKVFKWDEEKNKKLLKERNISFEQILVCLENNKLIDIIQNPSHKHKNQHCLVIDYNSYCYLVPFTEEKQEYFLKTIIPSRKQTKKYLKERKKNI